MNGFRHVSTCIIFCEDTSSVDERVQTRDFPIVLAVLTTSVLTFTLSAGQIQDAPDRVISGHGVELINDGRVFLLFAGLNSLGYSKETLRKGPPLEAPVFHPLRILTRDSLRKLNNQGKLKPLKDLFESQEQSIDNYIRLILSYDRKLTAAGKDMPSELSKIAAATTALRELSTHKDVQTLVNALSDKQRAHAKKLMAVLEKDFTAAEKNLGLKAIKAPTSLSVIPNPLDSHDLVREIEVGDKTVFVVGPGEGAARTAILQAALKPMVSKWVTDNWVHARKLKKHWRGLKVSKRITARFPDGQAYLTATLTRALVFQSGISNSNGKLDPEDFIDQETKEGYRWTRACLKALGKRNKSAGIDEDFAKLIKAIAP